MLDSSRNKRSSSMLQESFEAHTNYANQTLTSNAANEESKGKFFSS